MTEEKSESGVDQEWSTARTEAPASNRLRAFMLGAKDGWSSRGDLTFGRTWDDDQDCNEAYDHGVTFGERVVWVVLG